MARSGALTGVSHCGDPCLEACWCLGLPEVREFTRHTARVMPRRRIDQGAKLWRAKALATEHATVLGHASARGVRPRGNKFAKKERIGQVVIRDMGRH